MTVPNEKAEIKSLDSPNLREQVLDAGKRLADGTLRRFKDDANRAKAMVTVGRSEPVTIALVQAATSVILSAQYSGDEYVKVAKQFLTAMFKQHTPNSATLPKSEWIEDPPPRPIAGFETSTPVTEWVENEPGVYTKKLTPDQTDGDVVVVDGETR
jgi:hypothetical protein